MPPSEIPWYDAAAIARRLQAARGRRSQREVGAALGYLQPHVSRYERGDVPGSYRYLAGLAAVYGIDVNWVLTGRRASRLLDGFPAEAEERLLEALRRFVREIAPHAAGAPPSAVAALSAASPASAVAATLRVPEPAASEASSNPAPHVSAALEGSWEEVLLELPLLLSPLLSRGFGAPAGPQQSAAEDAPGVATPAREDGDEAAFLAEVREAAARRDRDRVLERLERAAAVLEETDPSPASLERARFLLVWAWALAERGAGDISIPGMARGTPAPVRAGEVLFRLGRVTRKSGRLGEAERLYRLALSSAAEAGQDEIAARCHAGLGHLFFERGEFDRARREYVSLLEAALRAGRPELLYFAYLDLSAYYHEHERDYEKASGYAAAGLEIARREGDLEHVGRFINELGLNDLELGRTEAAKARFREALEIGERTGSPLLLAVAGNNLGDLELRSGVYREAATLLRRSREVAARAGLVWAQCQAEILLARLEHAELRTARALDRLQEVEERAAANGLARERDTAREVAREIQRGVLGRLNALNA